jgi:hypothetical protein
MWPQCGPGLARAPIVARSLISGRRVPVRPGPDSIPLRKFFQPDFCDRGGVFQIAPILAVCG